MCTIPKVCLILSLLLPALIPICIYGDTGGETCSGESATVGTEEQCVSTEDVRSIPHSGKQLIQEAFQENGEEPKLSKGNTVERPVKVAQQTESVDKTREKSNIEDKTKPLRAEEQGRNQDKAKLEEQKVNLKSKEMEAREQEQKKKEANANKPKKKANSAVLESTDPKRVASAIAKDIKEDDARRASEYEKIHLDIEEFTKNQAAGSSEDSISDVHLAVQVCGDRMPETVVLLKSARMLSRVHLHFHVFIEEELKSQLKQELEAWPSEARKQTTLDIRSLSFPPENAKTWKGLERNKVCATQRLFLPDLLLELDAVLYVDTDIVFMRPPEDFWRLFHHFNNSHIAALAREQEEGQSSWYNRFSRSPYVLPIGVNSGVILMNLTRMRTENWVPAITSYLTEYRNKLAWGDQDLVNIFFHFKPEMLFLFQCHWNFRSDHCMNRPLCPPALEYGANLVHGSRRVFINDKKPTFKLIYNAFKEHNLGEDLIVLLERLKMGLAADPDRQHRMCGKVSGHMIKQLERQVALVTKAKQEN